MQGQPLVAVHRQCQRLYVAAHKWFGGWRHAAAGGWLTSQAASALDPSTCPGRTATSPSSRPAAVADVARRRVTIRCRGASLRKLERCVADRRARVRVPAIVVAGSRPRRLAGVLPQRTVLHPRGRPHAGPDGTSLFRQREERMRGSWTSAPPRSLDQAARHRHDPRTLRARHAEGLPRMQGQAVGRGGHTVFRQLVGSRHGRGIKRPCSPTTRHNAGHGSW